MNKIRNLVYSLSVPLPVQEAVLEGLRLALFAALSTLVTFLIEQVGTLPNPEAWTVILTIALRLVDKYKHQSNKLKSKNKNTNGLVF